MGFNGIVNTVKSTVRAHHGLVGQIVMATAAMLLVSCSSNGGDSAATSRPAATATAVPEVTVSSSSAPTSAPPSTTPPTTTPPPTTPPTTTPAPATLRSLADERGLLIGSAAADDPLVNEADYRDTLARQFNMVEAEDVLKWDVIHPAEDTYDFAPGDRLVAFAEEHGQTVRGHTLVWFQANPDWLTKRTMSRDEAIAVLKDHITTVVSHYKGRIAQWDVVNEALTEGDMGGLRDNIWLQTIGPDYIKLAFEFAHAADPEAKLFYNDYDWQSPGPKTDFIIALAKQLRDEGAPIDGVGIQFHVVLFPLDAKAEAPKLAELAALGLDVAITEADNGLQLPVTDEKLAAQAVVFRELLDLCLTNSRCTTFNMWGFTDRHSWISQYIPGFGAATIFDEQMQPKPAFDALLARLAEP
jgi:endo-1,4-beta-xylanase